MELVIAIVITIVACAVVVYAVVSGLALLDIRRVRRFIQTLMLTSRLHPNFVCPTIRPFCIYIQDGQWTENRRVEIRDF